MPKNINFYFLVIAILLVLFQLIYPPYVKDSYSYIIFVLGLLIINKAYSFLKSVRKEKNFIVKSFYTQDLSFLFFLSNTIAFASFFYFFYLHTIVFDDAMDYLVGNYTEEYLYHGRSFFITKDAFDAMIFWENSIFLLIPYEIIISTLYSFQKRNQSVEQRQQSDNYTPV